MKICFVSPFAYPLLVDGGSGAGGAERQFFLFGRGLAVRGWQVSFITHKPPYKICGLQRAFPVYPADFSYLGGSKWNILGSWLSLLLAMRRAAAQYYVIKVPGHLLPIMALYCKTYKSKLVFWAQMTYDSNPKERTIGKFIGFLQDIGIHLVDIIIAQSVDQQNGFSQNYGRTAHLVRSICAQLGPEKTFFEQTPWVDVLWVGNCHAKKRPEVCLELARLMPEVQFAMAMNNNDRLRFMQYSKEAAEMSNLKFLGQIPHVEMENWFSHTRFFLNTSLKEGFPNTFLQAWINAVPVISLGIDPDHLIRNHGLGKIAEQDTVVRAGENAVKLAECLVSPLRELLQHEEVRREMGLKAARFVKEQHAPDVTVPALINVLTGITL